MPRRVNLAVVAHIRHNYTNYDQLFRIGLKKHEARRGVEQFTLDKLVSWRGEEDDDEDPIFEDVLREVVVISDDEDEDNEDSVYETSEQHTPAQQPLPEQLQSVPIDLTLSEESESEDDEIYRRTSGVRRRNLTQNESRETREGQERHARWEQAINRHKHNPLPADSRTAMKAVIAQPSGEMVGHQAKKTPVMIPGLDSYNSSILESQQILGQPLRADEEDATFRIASQVSVPSPHIEEPQLLYAAYMAWFYSLSQGDAYEWKQQPQNMSMQPGPGEQRPAFTSPDLAVGRNPFDNSTSEPEAENIEVAVPATTHSNRHIYRTPPKPHHRAPLPLLVGQEEAQKFNLHRKTITNKHTPPARHPNLTGLDTKDQPSFMQLYPSVHNIAREIRPGIRPGTVLIPMPASELDDSGNVSQTLPSNDPMDQREQVSSWRSGTETRESGPTVLDRSPEYFYKRHADRNPSVSSFSRAPQVQYEVSRPDRSILSRSAVSKNVPIPQKMPRLVHLPASHDHQLSEDSLSTSRQRLTFAHTINRPTEERDPGCMSKESPRLIKPVRRIVALDPKRNQSFPQMSETAPTASSAELFRTHNSMQPSHKLVRSHFDESNNSGPPQRTHPPQSYQDSDPQQLQLQPYGSLPATYPFERTNFRMPEDRER